MRGHLACLFCRARRTMLQGGSGDMDHVNRRTFLGVVPAAMLMPSISIRAQTAAAASFPRQEAPLVSEMVRVAHGNIARVKELIADRPALARAAWDWGYGDWETALGAASHVGNAAIAQLLLDNGAHPTIFSAAMLGQLDVVKAFVAAAPGVQKIRGPHGISLLAHARNGGSAEMVKCRVARGRGSCLSLRTSRRRRGRSCRNVCVRCRPDRAADRVSQPARRQTGRETRRGDGTQSVPPRRTGVQPRGRRSGPHPVRAADWDCDIACSH